MHCVPTLGLGASLRELSIPAGSPPDKEGIHVVESTQARGLSAKTQRASVQRSGSGCQLDYKGLQAAWTDPHWVPLPRNYVHPQIPRLSCSNAGFPSTSGTACRPEPTYVQLGRNMISSLFGGSQFSHHIYGTWGPRLVSSGHPGEGLWLGIPSMCVAFSQTDPLLHTGNHFLLLPDGRKPTGQGSVLFSWPGPGTPLVLNESW